MSDWRVVGQGEKKERDGHKAGEVSRNMILLCYWTDNAMHRGGEGGKKEI